MLLNLRRCQREVVHDAAARACYEFSGIRTCLAVRTAARHSGHVLTRCELIAYAEQVVDVTGFFGLPGAALDVIRNPGEERIFR